MTLYLSQKKLFCLLLGAFVIGFVMAVFYRLLSLITPKQPEKRIWRVFWRIVRESRDTVFFVLFGIADAILLYVYHAGRVRISVFVLNFLGFAVCRMTLLPILDKIWDYLTRIFGKIVKHKDQL